MTTGVRDHLSRGALAVESAAGSVTGVLVALGVLLGFLAVGLARGFTDHWFSVLHAVTGSTAFAMVFLIQHTNGRQSRAALRKLDELVGATDGASNRVVQLEKQDLHEQEQVEDHVRPEGGVRL